MSGPNELAAIADDYWETWLELHPLDATAFGERRFDSRLPPIDPADEARSHDRLSLLRRRLGALPADEGDPVTRSALAETIDAELAFVNADHYAYTVDPMGGPQVSFLNVPSYQPVRTPDQGRAMVERWRAMGPWIETLTSRLTAGAQDGRTPVVELVRRVVDELDDLLSQPVEQWPLVAPATEAHEDWSSAERERFASALDRAVRDEIRPAFVRYRSVLADQLLAAARPQERVGLAHLPGGAETYRRLARAHTSVDTPSEELHRIGQAEVERIDAEMAALGRAMLGAGSLEDTLRRLRGDPALRFATRDEVAEVASRSLERARAVIPHWFGRLPRASCEVVVMKPHEEKHSTIAYYREPAADGSRPGQYYVNTSEPQTRPRYEAEALAFHEAIPGHHLQIAIAQELDRLPAFRRFWGSTAYVEGWGLYAERLSDEMGLYSGDLDRFGVLSFDAWRACRLVVDTGMHAQAWSRDAAIQFMTEHTALAENNIANEVDRYIAHPGQALAYKVGQLELLALRSEAQARLGPGFDVRRFHDVVLGEGALPLPTLREIVSRELAPPA